MDPLTILSQQRLSSLPHIEVKQANPLRVTLSDCSLFADLIKSHELQVTFFSMSAIPSWAWIAFLVENATELSYLIQAARSLP